MKTGDVVLDSEGRSYQVGPLLGRGHWGKSYLVRHGDSRAEYVLKSPLGRDDFKGDVPLTDDLLQACAAACTEQGALLARGQFVFLPPVQATGADTDGPMLILPRFTTTLDRRISQGCGVAEVLEVLLETLGHLHKLSEDGLHHGNLRPSNVLLNDRGEVLLTDLVTPAYRKVLSQLHSVSPDPNRYLPPEVISAGADAPIGQLTDTYAIGMILYRVVMTPREGEADGRPVALPSRGLDKPAIVELKDRTVERLKAEDSNPRFHARFAERLASLLNRALSFETNPSPPFRFARVAEMVPRLQELRSLIRPEVSGVGKVMLDRPPNSSTFETDEEIAFTISVTPSAGVDHYEEIATGIAVFDAETDERIRDVQAQYTVDRHPSGRFRFAFTLLDLAPGRYRTRVAFAIRDSGHPPRTTEIDFEVRAAAGYVPPSSEHAPQAIPFAKDSENPTSVTEPAIHPPSDEGTAADTEGPPASPQPDAHDAGELDDLLDDLPTPIAPGRAQAGRKLEEALAQATPAEPTFNVDMPDSPDTMSKYLDSSGTEEQEATEPAVQVASQLPEPDALRDIVGAGSWTDVPLPGTADAELGRPPQLDDAPEPGGPGALQKLTELLKGDAYLMYMALAGAFIVVLFIILFFLRNS